MAAVQQQKLSVVQSVPVKPYDFDADFESLVVYYSCTNPRFWGKVGHAIDPKALRDERARDLMIFAGDFAKSLGRGPDGSTVLIQRMRKLVTDGKKLPAWLAEREEFFDEVSDAHSPMPNPDDVAAEASEVMRRRLEGELIQELITKYTTRQPLDEVIRKLLNAQRLGLVSMDSGVKLGGEVFEAIDRMRHVDRMTVGVPELDIQLDGGMGRSQLGVALASSGGGKSMYLAGLSAAAYVRGFNVVYATLELPEPVVMARVISNITGVLVADILKGGWAQAKTRLEKLQGKGAFGTFVVKEFPAKATTLEDLKVWLDHVEATEGYKVDVIVIDYLDKCVSPQDDNSYDAMGTLYEGLRLEAVSRKCWAWTASQTKNMGGASRDPKKRADLDDMADSTNKGRVSDLVISLNVDEDNSTIVLKVVKNRHGNSRFEVGPLPTDFARGRICPDLNSHVAGGTP